ncbi:hypothetical protein BLNAU_3804 [Blattamonas nauphoetae]|uniref:Uncharacterized protein n=1 Tax=Blattamonas nauphoetae TaxID=2049346 RepID=A0ABQ9YCF6_9EUKA|nr:hypothetical protein BLNAU_3804 [Blattamonas nauphoetae]
MNPNKELSAIRRELYDSLTNQIHPPGQSSTKTPNPFSNLAQSQAHGVSFQSQSILESSDAEKPVITPRPAQQLFKLNRPSQANPSHGNTLQNPLHQSHSKQTTTIVAKPLQQPSFLSAQVPNAPVVRTNAPVLGARPRSLYSIIKKRPLVTPPMQSRETIKDEAIATPKPTTSTPSHQMPKQTTQFPQKPRTSGLTQSVSFISQQTSRFASAQKRKLEQKESTSPTQTKEDNRDSPSQNLPSVQPKKSEDGERNISLKLEETVRSLQKELILTKKLLEEERQKHKQQASLPSSSTISVGQVPQTTSESNSLPNPVEQTVSRPTSSQQSLLPRNSTIEEKPSLLSHAVTILTPEEPSVPSAVPEGDEREGWEDDDKTPISARQGLVKTHPDSSAKREPQPPPPQTLPTIHASPSQAESLLIPTYQNTTDIFPSHSQDLSFFGSQRPSQPATELDAESSEDEMLREESEEDDVPPNLSVTQLFYLSKQHFLTLPNLSRDVETASEQYGYSPLSLLVSSLLESSIDSNSEEQTEVGTNQRKKTLAHTVSNEDHASYTDRFLLSQKITSTISQDSVQELAHLILSDVPSLLKRLNPSNFSTISIYLSESILFLLNTIPSFMMHIDTFLGTISNTPTFSIPIPESTLNPSLVYDTTLNSLFNSTHFFSSEGLQDQLIFSSLPSQTPPPEPAFFTHIQPSHFVTSPRLACTFFLSCVQIVSHSGSSSLFSETRLASLLSLASSTVDSYASSAAPLFQQPSKHFPTNAFFTTILQDEDSLGTTLCFLLTFVSSSNSQFLLSQSTTSRSVLSSLLSLLVSSHQERCFSVTTSIQLVSLFSSFFLAKDTDQTRAFVTPPFLSTLSTHPLFRPGLSSLVAHATFIARVLLTTEYPSRESDDTISPVLHPALSSLAAFTKLIKLFMTSVILPQKSKEHILHLVSCLCLIDERSELMLEKLEDAFSAIDVDQPKISPNSRYQLTSILSHEIHDFTFSGKSWTHIECDIKADSEIILQHFFPPIT